MTSLEKLLEEIKLLNEKSKNIMINTESLDLLIKFEKRKTILKELSNAITYYLNQGKRKAATYLTTEEHIFVQTQHRIIKRGKGVKKGIIPAFINDDQLINLIKIYREEPLEKFDNEESRLVYLDEFRERGIILIKSVTSGKLDDQIDKNPNEVIHEINGRCGKLLPRLEIDPLQGRTYKYLQNLAKMKET